jgi:hypothetical protein
VRELFEEDWDKAGASWDDFETFNESYIINIMGSFRRWSKTQQFHPPCNTDEESS